MIIQMKVRKSDDVRGMQSYSSERSFGQKSTCEIIWSSSFLFFSPKDLVPAIPTKTVTSFFQLNILPVPCGNNWNPASPVFMFFVVRSHEQTQESTGV